MADMRSENFGFYHALTMMAICGLVAVCGLIVAFVFKDGNNNSDARELFYLEAARQRYVSQPSNLYEPPNQMQQNPRPMIAAKAEEGDRMERIILELASRKNSQSKVDRQRDRVVLATAQMTVGEDEDGLSEIDDLEEIFPAKEAGDWDNSPSEQDSPQRHDSFPLLEADFSSRQKRESNRSEEPELDINLEDLPPSAQTTYSHGNLDEFLSKVNSLPIMNAATTLHWSLDDAINAALLHSFQIEELRITSVENFQDVGIQFGKFDTVSFFEQSFRDSSTPIGNNFESDGSVNRIKGEEFNFQYGVRQELLSGGQVELARQFGTRDDNSGILSPPNQASSQLSLTLRKELLKGSGKSIGMNEVLVANQAANAGRFENIAQMADLLQQVANAYWDIYSARAALISSIENANATQIIFNDLLARKELDADPNLLEQARVAYQQQLAEADTVFGDLAKAQYELVRLVNAPELLANVQRIEIIPTDIDFGELVPPDVASRQNTAIHNRPEVRQVVEEIGEAQLQHHFSINQLLPKLTFNAEAAFEGLSGDRDLEAASRNKFDQDATYELGFNFELPLQNRQARYGKNRAELVLAKLQQRWSAAVELVKKDVLEAVQDIEVSRSLIDRQRRIFQASSDRLSFLELRRYRIPKEGAIPSFQLSQLLDVQSQVTSAKADFARSLADRKRAEFDLNRASGILVQPAADCLGHPGQNQCLAIYRQYVEGNAHYRDHAKLLAAEIKAAARRKHTFRDNNPAASFGYPQSNYFSETYTENMVELSTGEIVDSFNEAPIIDEIPFDQYQNSPHSVPILGDGVVHDSSWSSNTSNTNSGSLAMKVDRDAPQQAGQVQARQDGNPRSTPSPRQNQLNWPHTRSQSSVVQANYNQQSATQETRPETINRNPSSLATKVDRNAPQQIRQSRTGQGNHPRSTPPPRRAPSNWSHIGSESSVVQAVFNQQFVPLEGEPETINRNPSSLATKVDRNAPQQTRQGRTRQGGNPRSTPPPRQAPSNWPHMGSESSVVQAAFNQQLAPQEREPETINRNPSSLAMKVDRNTPQRTRQGRTRQGDDPRSTPSNREVLGNWPHKRSQSSVSQANYNQQLANQERRPEANKQQNLGYGPYNGPSMNLQRRSHSTYQQPYPAQATAAPRPPEPAAGNHKPRLMDRLKQAVSIRPKPGNRTAQPATSPTQQSPYQSTFDYPVARPTGGQTTPEAGGMSNRHQSDSQGWGGGWPITR